ncbi:hypothetical protein Ahy_B03g067966 isoform D [Arachis hypogaea]|uniref:Uncharacterized protein n=1 Tax=Arachis hypogaea TaxID=3818 RepID=A0A445A877_ARAHY|nr:hypothetical protein Ahy_B03g067966 isoform D [Arachis hypogaea]
MVLFVVAMLISTSNNSLPIATSAIQKNLGRWGCVSSSSTLDVYRDHHASFSSTNHLPHGNTAMLRNNHQENNQSYN